MTVVVVPSGAVVVVVTHDENAKQAQPITKVHARVSRSDFMGLPSSDGNALPCVGRGADVDV